LEQLELQIPLVEREFGDDFTFSTALLQTRLQPFQTSDGMYDYTDTVEKHIRSINLNLSLSHSQTAFAESWQFFLRQAVPYLRGDPIVRPAVLSIAEAISSDIAKETRSGDLMSSIHDTRLSLLLSLLEVAWFSTADKPGEIKSFVGLVDNIPGILLNEAQSPAKSILGTTSVPFHRTLLQIVYFCTKHSRTLSQRPNILHADQRLRIGVMLEAALTLVVDGLRVVFDSARNRVDTELDRDMELLVSVFEQCTRLDINPSSTFWLIRCQETDVIKSSLNLLVQTDLTGLVDIPLLLARKRSFYSPFIFMFHMALASIPAAAERLASEGVLVAYSNTSISQAISAGTIDVQLPELPGERSPAHQAYCAMLAVVAGVVTALGRHNHYFDAEASGLVQLFGDQISRALSWTIGDALTLPLLEEMEQVVGLFSSIADHAPSSANPSPVVVKILRVFTTHALLLLQQINYALTHPNHLASLVEPVTTEERAQLTKDPQEQDRLKLPIINRLVNRLFRLSNMLVSTLISISRADSILIAEQEDWPIHEATLVPVRQILFYLF
jgi:nuclear pore complex protein Nup188